MLAFVKVSFREFKFVDYFIQALHSHTPTTKHSLQPDCGIGAKPMPVPVLCHLSYSLSALWCGNDPFMGSGIGQNM